MSDSVTGAGSPFDQKRIYRPQDERIPSIWQDRKQHLFNTSPTGTPPVAPSEQLQQEDAPFRSRARAGTLPSRLSPGLQINSNLATHNNSSLGSLALLSPHRSSPDSPLYHAKSSSMIPDLRVSGTTNTSSTPLTTPPQPNRLQPQQQQPPQQSRLRSGSLNLLSENRPSFSPFGPSIWASPSNTPGGSQSGTQTPKRLSQQSVLNAHQEEVPEDPMQPFLNELAVRTDVNRLRSYTVNTLPPAGPAGIEEDIIQQQYSQKLQQYNQAQQSSNQGHPYGHVHPSSSSHQQQHLNQTPNHQQSPHGHHLHHQLLNQQTRPRAQTTTATFDRLPQHQSSNEQLANSPHPHAHQNHNHHEDISRSLWLGNVPPSTTSYALQAIFSPYGYVESARVLAHKNCAFIDFSTIESAIQAKNVLNGKELFNGSGPCKVGFAKSVLVPFDRNDDDTAALEKGSGGTDIEYSVVDKNGSGSTGNSTGSGAGQKEVPQAVAVKSLEEISEEMLHVIKYLADNTVLESGGDGTSTKNYQECASFIKRALAYKDFKTSEIPPVPEPNPDRVYDAPTLREVRKKVDSGMCSVDEIEEIAIEMLDDIAELSSDYVGNTVVQKLFDICSEPVKELMLKRISPHLAEIGVHKNGTWAAQKIIDVASTDRQIDTITKSLRPYTVNLFLDQFGNYVIQCCLKFGRPWNDFIFETMLSRFWDIAQGRFGARAMRACLESTYATKEQQEVLAAAIALHSVQLATNANGALLLTWFLDTCSLPNRHAILAPRLVSDLVPLCTHKLACLTVLKVINHKGDPEARQLILRALFDSSDEAQNNNNGASDGNGGSVLFRILSDHMYGPTFIYKVISTPVLDYNDRQSAVQKIRNVLMTIKALPSQGYKRLMDEVGLSTRSSSQRNGNTNNSGNSNSNNNGGGGNSGKNGGPSINGNRRANSTRRGNPAGNIGAPGANPPFDSSPNKQNVVMAHGDLYPQHAQQPPPPPPELLQQQFDQLNIDGYRYAPSNIAAPHPHHPHPPPPPPGMFMHGGPPPPPPQSQAAPHPSHIHHQSQTHGIPPPIPPGMSPEEFMYLNGQNGAGGLVNPPISPGYQGHGPGQGNQFSMYDGQHR